MNDFYDDELIKSLYREKIQNDNVKDALDLAMKILDRIEPEWKRDVEYRKLGIKILGIVIKYVTTAVDKADSAYLSAYDHEIEVNRGWGRPSRRLRRTAQERALDVSNERYNMFLDFLFSMLDWLGPSFFSIDGQKAVSSLESNLSNVINITNGRHSNG
jgi:hypothetical protein